MRILLSEAPGSAETLVLRQVDAPQPGPGQVRVAVRAIGVNYPDSLIIEDRYQIKPGRPFAPGAELAGVVDAVGAQVTTLKPGDRVMALPLWGAMAEKVCVAADSCHPIPDAVADQDAAALQMTYGTALYALEERGNLKRGETVVVLGAAGGVGLAAVQLAKGLGARVIAAASSLEKLAKAMEHGADTGIVYPRGPLDKEAQRAFGAELRRALGGQGADIILDIVGGDYTEPALRCMNWGGRFLIIGFPAGIARIPANLPLLKSCDVRGVFWGASIERDPAANRAAMQRLLALCAEKTIRPPIHGIYPLDQGGEAIASLTRRDVLGKVIVIT